MKTCKDCICLHRCKELYDTFVIFINIEEMAVCDFFKDKSKFIELPCAIGTTVYMISTCHDEWSGYDFKKIIQASFRLDMLKDFNKRFFLTREEAEKKLEELNG